MRKILLLAILGMLNCSVISAQDVTVTGMGIDRESAIRDASRKAVEQVVGTFVDSRTLMENLKIQFDEVYKKSRGFVKAIKILSEGKVDSISYQVQAKVEVDVEPGGKLLDEISMLMQLNDPRISVIILESNKDKVLHVESAESVLNAKLLELGFSHVTSANHIIKLDNASLLKDIYFGKVGNFSGEMDNAIDFLVIGKYVKNARTIFIPAYGESGMKETDLLNVKANLKIDILKYDTGEIVASFTTSGTGVESTSERTEEKALEVASEKAAEKLADTFRKFGAKTSQGLTFTITSDSAAKLEQVINELRQLGIIDNIQLRELKENSAVLAIETSQKPYAIVEMLKARSKLGIFVENITNSTCKLKIS